MNLNNSGQQAKLIIDIVVLMIAILAMIGAYFVPEVRLFLGLDPLVASNSPRTKIIMSDRFEKDGDYDQNLWACAQGDCSRQNVFQQDSSLHLQLAESGDLYLESLVKSKIEGRTQLEGAFKVSKGSAGGVWLFFAFGPGCGIVARPENTVFKCSVGPNALDNYLSDEITVDTDQWYAVRLEIEPIKNEYLFYLDNSKVAQFQPKYRIDEAKAGFAIWRDQDSQKMEGQFDNITVQIIQ